MAGDGGETGGVMEELVIREGRAEDLAGVAAVQAESPEAPAWRVEEYLTYQLDVAERGGHAIEPPEAAAHPARIEPGKHAHLRR